MENKIENIDFRNAHYQGYIKDAKFHNIGIILSEDFLFCLAEWDQGLINGPCLTIFPNETIFYGFFKENFPEGLCCFQMSNDCSIYCNFSNSQMSNRCIAHFPFIQCLLEVTIGKTGEIQEMQEHYYESVEEKEKIIERLLKTSIKNSQKEMIDFIKKEFVAKWDALEDSKGLDYFIGMRGEGLGIKFDVDDWALKSIGNFKENKILNSMGKVIVREEMKVIEEGIHNKPETLIRYLNSERPDKIRKVYRDQFRLGMNFQNKFLNLSGLETIEKNLNLLKIRIRDNTTEKIAQELIESSDGRRKVKEIVENATNRSRLTPHKNKEKQNNKLNNKNPTGEVNERMMNEVPLKKIKEELDRSLIHRKYGESPYKEFDLTPAELKYTTFTHGYEKEKEMTSSYKKNMMYEESKLQNRAYPGRDLNKEKDYLEKNVDRYEKEREKRSQRFKYLDENTSKSTYDIHENKSVYQPTIRTHLSKSPNAFEAIMERSKQIEDKIYSTPITNIKNPYVTLSATADSNNNTIKQKERGRKYNDLTGQLADALRQTDYERAQIGVGKDKRSPYKQLGKEMGFKEIKYCLPQENTIKKEKKYYDSPSKR